MRIASLRGVCRRRRVKTTRRDAQAQISDDLVQRQFRATEPNALWVSDITYLPTWQGFLYLAVVIDAYSRRVVGWSMANHLRTELVLDALEMALWNRRPAPGLIHHSDHGCQTGFKGSSQHLPRRCDGSTKATTVGSGTPRSNALTRSSTGGTSRGSATFLVDDCQRPDHGGRWSGGGDFTRCGSPLVPAKWGHAFGQPGSFVGPLSVVPRARGDRPASRQRQWPSRDR
jgi:hypothetical protein